MAEDLSRENWRVAAFVLLTVFFGLALAFALTGMHWAWWLGIVPVGLVMGYAFGRINADDGS